MLTYNFNNVSVKSCKNVLILAGVIIYKEFEFLLNELINIFVSKSTCDNIYYVNFLVKRLSDISMDFNLCELILYWKFQYFFIIFNNVSMFLLLALCLCGVFE